jgi:hypothetical protein
LGRSRGTVRVRGRFIDFEEVLLWEIVYYQSISVWMFGERFLNAYKFVRGRRKCRYPLTQFWQGGGEKG